MRTRDQYDAVLLDLDGVIADTASLHARLRIGVRRIPAEARGGERRSFIGRMLSSATSWRPKDRSWLVPRIDAEGSLKGLETLLTVTFEDHDGRTKLTLRQAGFESATSRNSHHGGWTDSLQRLTQCLANA